MSGQEACSLDDPALADAILECIVRAPQRITSPASMHRCDNNDDHSRDSSKLGGRCATWKTLGRQKAEIPSGPFLASLAENALRRRLQQFANTTVFAVRRLPALASLGTRLELDVTTRAFCCIDSRGDKLLQKNDCVKWPPASLTKLVTALVLIEFETRRLNEWFRIERQDCVRGSSAHLQAGDSVRLVDLLYGMMLPSGNDAAHAIARIVGGALPRPSPDPVSRFVAEMNRLTTALGLTRTRFVNPGGRDRPCQYSTAFDLARLAHVAFAHPILRKACGTARYRIEVRGERPRDIELRSTVSTLDEPGILCGKTGSTRTAKGCLALRSVVAGEEATLVVLGSDLRFTAGNVVIPETDRRFDESQAILEYIRHSKVHARRLQQ